MWVHVRWLVLAVVVGVLLVDSAPLRAQEGWTITRFHAEIALRPDASMRVVESIDVDFGTLEKHGIFREIPIRYSYNADYQRVYDLKVESVTDANGKRWPYTREQVGANVRLKIGDPDRTIRGAQSYRITYTVQGALNAFPDHDELYWNVNGRDWPVPTQSASATVLLTGDALGDAACYQGARSTDPCAFTRGEGRIDYQATRGFVSGEELTIVAAVRKGALAAPPVLLRKKPRTFLQYFEVKPTTVGASLATLLVGVVLIGSNWWARGRDRRYTSLYHLSQNPEEETRPLFGGQTVVVEYQPPDGIRPAEIGVLQDERAHTLDVTATIIDLAVRGYLTISEVPKTGILKVFKKQDWMLARTRADTDGLQPYERTVFTGLFASGENVTLQSLKNKYHTTLASAQKQLYKEVTEKGWFTANPETARGMWAFIGLGVAAVGGGLIWLLGKYVGAGLVGIPVVVVGLLLVVTSGSMVRRTAKGSEVLRRTLGFREYIATAETDRQQFNERANIFAEYLPYAMVFGLVERWANAFRDIDLTATTAGWYGGSTAFHSGSFSRSLSGFSSSVSSTIASTPSSSGSGFGGSSGGGGGGGGGGSW